MGAPAIDRAVLRGKGLLIFAWYKAVYGDAFRCTDTPKIRKGFSLLRELGTTVTLGKGVFFNNGYSITYGGVRLGLIESFFTSRMSESRVRDNLGFAQINSVGFIGARICTAVVVLHRKKTPWLSLGICLAIAVIVEVVANSRTFELFILVLAVLSLMLWYRERHGKLTAKGYIDMLLRHTCDMSAYFRVYPKAMAQAHSFPAGLIFEDAATVYRMAHEVSDVALVLCDRLWAEMHHYRANLLQDAGAKPVRRAAAALSYLGMGSFLAFSRAFDKAKEGGDR